MNFKLEDAGVFPDTTVVGVYNLSQMPAPAGQLGKPTGAALSTQEMSGGSCTFTGLTSGNTYFAAAEVGSVWRYVQFTVGAAPVGHGFSGAALPSANENISGNWTFSGTVGFNGSVPFAQPAAYTQTYATASRTVAASTAVAVAETAPTKVEPYGFTEAQAKAILAAVNANGVDIVANRKVLNSVINDLKGYGLLQ